MSQVRQRMLFASSREDVKRGLGTSNFVGELHGTDKSELSAEALELSCRRGDAAAYLTDAERVKAAVVCAAAACDGWTAAWFPGAWAAPCPEARVLLSRSDIRARIWQVRESGAARAETARSGMAVVAFPATERLRAAIAGIGAGEGVVVEIVRAVAFAAVPSPVPVLACVRARARVRVRVRGSIVWWCHASLRDTTGVEPGGARRGAHRRTRHRGHPAHGRAAILPRAPLHGGRGARCVSDTYLHSRMLMLHMRWRVHNWRGGVGGANALMRTRVLVALVYSCPEAAPTRLKMIYSTAKSSLIDVIATCGVTVGRQVRARCGACTRGEWMPRCSWL